MLDTAAAGTSPRKRLVAAAALSAIAIIATLAVCISQPGTSFSLASFSGLHFSYHAVDEWPGECHSGKRQMPVDIDSETSSFKARNPLLWWNLLSSSILTKLGGNEESSIMFNGHTVQITPDASPIVNYEGKNYELLQFHFHTPSENRIDGHSSASEMHMVHKSNDGSLMVFAVLLDIDHSELADASLSPHSPASKLLDASESPLNAVFEALPVLAHRVYEHRAQLEHSASHEHPAHDTVEMPLLGFSIGKLTDYFMKTGVANNYFFIPGSLTTPPCTEGVHWVVSAKRLIIPSSALTMLMQMEGENSRVLQSYNSRVVHKNFK